MRTLRLLGPALAGLLFAEGAEAADPFLRSCRTEDPALQRTAQLLAERKASGVASPLADELGLLARGEGSRNPSPRALVLTGDDLEGDDALARTKSFLQGAGLDLACGRARIAGHTAVVAAPILFDFEDAKDAVRVGSWVTVKGTLRVTAAEAKLVVLGPRGLPQRVPTSLKDGRVLGRFRADREGRFVAQILADVDGGPKPVAEIVVVAGEPGPLVDDAGPKDEGDAAKLLAFVREREGLPALSRDADLDRLARAHAKAMAKARKVAHDVGDGDPAERVARELDVSLVGENVARGRDEATAHRLFWNSPSHRANLLGDRFTRFGLARERGEDGQVYVAELFAR